MYLLNSSAIDAAFPPLYMNLTFHFAMLVDSVDTTTVVSNAIPRDSHPKFIVGEMEKWGEKRQKNKPWLSIETYKKVKAKKEVIHRSKTRAIKEVTQKDYEAANKAVTKSVRKYKQAQGQKRYTPHNQGGSTSEMDCTR